jgi:thioredoxin 2
MSKTQTLTFRCPSCGTKNRIPLDKAGQMGKCGKCGTALNTTELLIDHPMVVDDGGFHQKIIQSPLPVLLDCWAPWCGPCKMIGPVMEELAGLWKGKIRVAKLNVDENPGTSEKFQIRSIPTMLIFDNGKRIDTLVGALPKQQIIQAMAPFL